MRTSQPTLRPAQRRDLAAIHELERATFGARGLPLAELSGLLSGPSGRAFVAVVDDCLLGYVVATSEPPWLELRSLAVDPAVRRRTIGAQLVRAVCRIVAAGSPRAAARPLAVRAMVSERRLAALELLKSEGFRAARLVRRYYAPRDEAAVCMVWRPWPAARGDVARGHGG